MKQGMLRIIGKWTVGLVLSLFAIWGVTAICTENFYPKIWSPELKRNVPETGWKFRNRSEGWATTRFGEFGLPGTKSVAGPEIDKILIWGDSFVEAFQVAEEDRMHRQLDGLFAESDRPYQVVGVGRRFQSMADYIFQIPLYEEVISPCRYHILHIHTLDDTYPDQNPDHRISLFLSEPEFRFERFENEYHEVEEPASPRRINNILYAANAQFFLKTKKRVFEVASMKGLRFAVGSQGDLQVASAETGSNRWSDYLNPEWVNREAPEEAWKFLVRSLREVTDLPLLIVYSPTTPTLDRGAVVTANPEAALVDVFAEVCQQEGVGFVNLESGFLDYHRETGAFPKGFPRSRPWEGHYNAVGHRIAAEAMYRWIKKKSHVVHSD